MEPDLDVGGECRMTSNLSRTPKASKWSSAKFAGCAENGIKAIKAEFTMLIIFGTTCENTRSRTAQQTGYSKNCITPKNA